MNPELFIARRLLKGGEKSSVSVPIVKIALVGIALGVCVMLLSVFIINGFKKEIVDKLSGFSSHLNIVPYGNSGLYGEDKIQTSDELLSDIRHNKGVKEVHNFLTKPAILKNKTEIHGIILYGVDSTYSGDFLADNLVAGEIPKYVAGVTSNDIVLSSSVAAYLDVQPGDNIQAHFVQEPPRVRVFRVKGVYDTGFKEYDDRIVICDLKHLQRLNGWENHEVSGIAVELRNIDLIEKAAEQLSSLIPHDDTKGYSKITTLYESTSQTFDWLELINTNVWVLMILILTVAGFNMVSGLLILILEKTTLIGILKTLGYRDLNLRKLFLYIAMGLIWKGIIWGNILAFFLGGIQYYFKIISLDPTLYYMDKVPVSFNLFQVLLLNAGVLAVCTLMLIIPTILISRIKPIKAIRFE